MNPIRDYMSEAIYQRCDVILIRIHLLLAVFEHNSNLSRHVILLKRMTSGVCSARDIARSVRKKFYCQRHEL